MPESIKALVAEMSPKPKFRFQLRGILSWLPAALALGVLWWRLIDHLRVEWSLNPQYGYGWAVPFLCLFLIFEKHFRVSEEPVGGHLQPTGATPSGPAIGIPDWAILSGLFLLGLAYLATRMVQEANPEWRLVSWGLAGLVVAATFLVVANQSSNHSLLRAFNPTPVLFFLVAVPWPTPVEGPLVQGLTRANASVAIELLGFLGVSALQHGNVIEVGSGAVGIDDACSGIRSFQASLMLALFFAFFYRSGFRRGLLLCAAGAAFSFSFNVIRTTLLTWIAAKQGTQAIAAWHDPAGVVILLACFISLWLVARKCRTDSSNQTASAIIGAAKPAVLASAGGVGKFRTTLIPLVFLSWIFLVEVGVETWYRWHERRLAEPVTWTVQLPTQNPGFRQVAFSETTQRMLRFDEGLNAQWEGPVGTRWQVIFLRWNPGRIAVHLAKSHTPQACLTAAGHQIESESNLHLLRVKGIELPFRSYLVRSSSGTLRVFYCLWEDRMLGRDRGFGPTSLSYRNRLEPVLAGQRNLGQRSVELAIWGIDDQAQAEQAVIEQLEQILVTQ
jgi:exosortase